MKHGKQISMPSDSENYLLTVQEVAKQLRVDDTTIRRWIRDGVLEAVTLPARGKRHIYRVRKRVLDALILSRAQQ